MLIDLWRCDGCGETYRIELHHCPRCNGSTFTRQERTVPKITQQLGPTDAGAKLLPEFTEEEPSQPDQGDGTNSSTSDARSGSSGKRQTQQGTSPAPTTESPSQPDRTDSSSADSTGGDQTQPGEGSTPPAKAQGKKAAPAKKAAPKASGAA